MYTTKFWPIFTREEMNQFLFELTSKFHGGIRSPEGVFYISLTIIGGFWASYFIPKLNGSEISPETYGIFTIGFLITVMLDAIVTFMRKNDNNPYEKAISLISIIFSFILIIVTSYLSLKQFHVSIDKKPTFIWEYVAQYLLVFVLLIAISMSIILTGIESNGPLIGSADRSIDDIKDR